MRAALPHGTSPCCSTRSSNSQASGRRARRSALGARRSALGVEAEAINERVKREAPGHEGDLVEADLQEPRGEFGQRPTRQVAAAVEIALPRHVGVIYHPLVLAAPFETARQAA